MEPEVSLPHSQDPNTRPFSEPEQSSPWSASHFLKIPLNIILPSTPGSSEWSPPQISPPKHSTKLSSPQYMLHAPPISFFLILSTEK